jgi:hypothetical protein
MDAPFIDGAPSLVPSGNAMGDPRIVWTSVGRSTNASERRFAESKDLAALI